MSLVTVRMTPGELGRVLRRRRVTLSRTQQEVADAARVSRQWLVKLERGHASAELALVLEVIHALDLTLALHDARSEQDLHASTRTDAVDLDAVLTELG